MKKIALIIVLSFFMVMLTWCGAKPNKVTDVEAFEELFNGAIKYDIRSDSECEDGHIKGFVCQGSLSKDKIIENIDLVSLDHKQNIILIGEEEDILYIFKGLAKKGFKNMYYFEGGFLRYKELKGNDYNPETGCGC